VSLVLIQPKFLTLTDLLINRLFRIPQYQRSYSWGSKQREDMFEDIRGLRSRPEQRHFMATVVGLNRGRKTIVTDEYSVIEVVDGQQRLTTLILLLKAIQLALKEKEAPHVKLAVELQDILIKQDELSIILLQMNHDPNGFFAEYLRTGDTSEPDVAKTLADKALLNAIRDCTVFVQGWPDLIQLTGIVKNRLTFIFQEIDDEATVYTVFEVLNSRGLAVPWLDRLKSLLTQESAYGHRFSTRIWKQSRIDCRVAYHLGRHLLDNWPSTGIEHGSTSVCGDAEICWSTEQGTWRRGGG